ncbi:hypothetical protein ACLKA7_013480 [Drosophila subpalustris]
MQRQSLAGRAELTAGGNQRTAGKDDIQTGAMSMSSSLSLSLSLTVSLSRVFIVECSRDAATGGVYYAGHVGQN